MGGTPSISGNNAFTGNTFNSNCCKGGETMSDIEPSMPDIVTVRLPPSTETLRPPSASIRMASSKGEMSEVREYSTELQVVISYK